MTMTVQRVAAFVALLALTSNKISTFCEINAFSVPGGHQHVRHVGAQIIDAEFLDNVNVNDNVNSDSDTSMTLIEYSQSQDPDWKSMPIAFCDTRSNTYIDCNLAFYVKDENGDEFCLGVPCDTPIVVAIELGSLNDDSATVEIPLPKVLPIYPDEWESGSSSADAVLYDMTQEEKEEIFRIAARALMEEFGDSDNKIRLKKTPRVLTVEGKLDQVIGNWKDILMDSNQHQLTLEDALTMMNQMEANHEEDYFDAIMKRDLGPDYMTLLEEEDDIEIDDELLKLFNFSNTEEDDKRLEDFFNENESSIMKENSEQNIKSGKSYDPLLQQLKPSAALRLMTFVGPREKEYTILRPLHPVLLVAKEDPEDYTRRLLLTEEERRDIIPKLERLCKDELEKAGFF